MYYAGIGSRSTPREVLDQMVNIARRLFVLGYTLRSGGADGADSAFERGAGNRKQIFIPWPGFNGRYARNDGTVFSTVSDAALEMAARYHPAWNRCSPGAKRLHARNCYQVLGLDLSTPAEFVVCWTPSAAREGGTGQALRIARAWDIPIYDLRKPGDLFRILDFITTTEEQQNEMRIMGAYPVD